MKLNFCVLIYRLEEGQTFRSLKNQTEFGRLIWVRMSNSRCQNFIKKKVVRSNLNTNDKSKSNLKSEIQTTNINRNNAFD